MGFHSTRYFPDITVGILGVGAIGKALAAVCKAHQLTVWGLTRTQHAVEDQSLHVDVYRTTENLMEFLTNCDYVVNLLPSTEETRDLLSVNMLQNCSAKKAVLINVGRGDIVDEESIVKAIENKWIGGAVLDTFVEEPLPTSSLLWSLPGVYITPHISGWSLSPQYIEFVAQSYVDNLERFLAGKPLHNVFDWERGY